MSAHDRDGTLIDVAGIPVMTLDEYHAVVRDEGSIWTFEVFGEAREWWSEHVQEAPRLGELYCVEHRFAIDLVRGLKDAGFRVEVR